MSIPAEHESRAPFPEIFAGRHPGDLCLHHLIEARAEQHPDAIAIVRGDETITYGADAIAIVRGDKTITYGELDRRASRLALYLASLGVEPEVTVGIYAPRSPEAIVAMLAVSKAGGAFLPLDPSYPEERLRFMIEDASARVILARGELPAGLRAGSPVRDLSGCAGC